MTLGKIGATIGALRAERYRWTRVGRAYIEKKNSSSRRSRSRTEHGPFASGRTTRGSRLYPAPSAGPASASR